MPAFNSARTVLRLREAAGASFIDSVHRAYRSATTRSRSEAVAEAVGDRLDRILRSARISAQLQREAPLAPLPTGLTGALIGGLPGSLVGLGGGVAIAYASRWLNSRAPGWTSFFLNHQDS
jgi:hypothetical protein